MSFLEETNMLHIFEVKDQTIEVRDELAYVELCQMFYGSALEQRDTGAYMYGVQVSNWTDNYGWIRLPIPTSDKTVTVKLSKWAA